MTERILSALACGRSCVCATSLKRERGLTHCPSHADPTPSLNVEERDGTTLVKCHGGCSQDAVIEALRGRGLWHEASPAAPIGVRREVARYDYEKADGSPAFTIVRYEPKDFRALGSVPEQTRVLYHLPEVLAAVNSKQTVYVAEGERDVDSLRQLGVVSTCNPFGAGKFLERFAEPLIGANVVICADADEPGRAHAQDVAQKVSVVASVKVLEFPAKDASDWIAAGGTRDQLLALVARTPVWGDRQILTGKDLVSMHAEVMARRMSGDPDYVDVPTGLSAELDKQIAYRSGDLILVVASTGVGKSALLTTMQLDLDRRGIPSMFVSLEMSWVVLVDRMLKSGVSLETLGERAGLLVDEPSLTVERLEVLAKVAKVRGARILFLDYAQRMIGDRKLSEYERVSVVSNELARIARTAGICIVAAAQVSRQGASRDGSAPQLSDIRSSGHLEQDAAVVLSIGRKTGEAETQVVIAKNRHGGTGYVRLYFDGERTTFTALQQAHVPGRRELQEIPY